MRTESLAGSAKGRGLRRTARLTLIGTAFLLLGGMGVVAGSAAAALPEEDPWGGKRCLSGSGAGQCLVPRGVAADAENGHVFVADSINRRIVEFNALGQFIKAWGWGIADDPGDGPQGEELQVCTAETGCFKGLTGSGTGQFGSPQGVTVDSAGNLYVVDRGLPSNARVQKFDRDGGFLLMFGGKVNKTKVEKREEQEAVPEPVTVTEEEENLCPFDPDDECQKGVQGSGQGQFGAWPVVGDWIAVDRNGTATDDTDDSVYVGDVKRIQRFNAAGVYQDECTIASTVQALDVDAAGNLYAIHDGEIHKLAPPPSCEELSPSFEVSSPSAVAVDSANHVFAFKGGGGIDPICEFAPDGSLIECFGDGEFNASTGLAANLCAESEEPGNLYVSNASEPNAFVRAYGTEPIGCFKARTLPASDIEETAARLNGTVNPKGEAVTECFFEYGETTAYDQEAECDPDASEIGTGSTPVPVHADIGGLTKGTVYHFRLLARVGGELEIGSDEEFKTLGPPVISEEHVVGATDSEATLKALVNPEGFATTCHYEYVTEAGFKASGFENAQSTEAIPAGSDRSEHPVVATLEGLAAGESYRWRIVCANSSDTATSADHPLRTYRTFAPETDCPNQLFRSGPSAFLPDCRAYEMVSPVDKNGGDIVSVPRGAGDPGGYMQAAPDGEKIAYTALTSFGDQPSSFFLNQYLAERRERGESEEGWTSHGIHPPVKGAPVDSDLFGFTREFMAFTPDLCSAWLIDYQTPPPTEDAQDGFRNLYRRSNCEPGAGALEVLVPAPPPLPAGTTSSYVDKGSVQGISADGRHALFVANAKLTADAHEGTNGQIYDRFEGGLSLVSVLPDGSGGDPAPGDGEGFANPGSSEVGSGFFRNLQGAVSADGSRVYWTAGSGSGEIYLRERPEQGIVAGECTTPGKACTVEVSEGTAFFWGAAADGSAALYEEGGNLFVFDLASGASEEVAEDVRGVAGISEDLARVYFVSDKAFPETAANEGEPNLYLYEAGAGGAEPTYALVATLVEGDMGALEPGAALPAYALGERATYFRATRVTPDGSSIAFNSRAALTDYDNTAQGSGAAAVEVYLYDAEEGELVCASCNPSEARPAGREMGIPYEPRNLRTKVTAAAWIPTWEHSLHASNVLSADGGRLFFNSNDALVPRDGNGAQDVYEWEAPGVGRCTEASPSFFAENGGCLYLISSGESPFESEFWEASPDGEDVFFTTESKLLPQDPGLIDLYDARVGGGFPLPVVSPPCEGEACQSPPPPPEFSAPPSSTYQGPGNERPSKAKRCRRGKKRVVRKGKARCVRKHRKGAKRRAKRSNHRRATR